MILLRRSPTHLWLSASRGLLSTQPPTRSARWPRRWSSTPVPFSSHFILSGGGRQLDSLSKLVHRGLVSATRVLPRRGERCGDHHGGAWLQRRGPVFLCGRDAGLGGEAPGQVMVVARCSSAHQTSRRLLACATFDDHFSVIMRRAVSIPSIASGFLCEIMQSRKHLEWVKCM